MKQGAMPGMRDLAKNFFRSKYALFANALTRYCEKNVVSCGKIT